MASIWLSSPEHRYDVMPVFMWEKKKSYCFFWGGAASLRGIVNIFFSLSCMNQNINTASVL